MSNDTGYREYMEIYEALDLAYTQGAITPNNRDFWTPDLEYII